MYGCVDYWTPNSLHIVSLASHNSRPDLLNNGAVTYIVTISCVS